jgi:2-methylcitrate dehydratase PrpD
MSDDKELSRELTRFVVETRYEDLSADVVERMKRSLLDLVGCALLGSIGETAPAFARYASAHAGRPEATIFGSGQRTSAVEAAFINGAHVHSTEMSETFTRALAHPGNSVIPAVLAVAERDGRSGRDVLTAVAIGYELLIRLGAVVGPNLVMEQGLHGPATLGIFGASAAAAKVGQLEAEVVRNAIGIGANSAPMSLIAMMYQQATAKDIFQGQAAALGVQSADLARAGITGPQAWIEPWLHAVPRTSDTSQLLKDLGTDWRVSSGGLHFKLLPVMAMAAPTLGALREILGEGPLAAADVAHVLVESSSRIDLGRIAFPDNMVAARASLPFLVGAVLSHPEPFLADPYLRRFLEPSLLADEQVRALARLVEMSTDYEFDYNIEKAWPMKFEARVTVRLANGEVRQGYWDTWPQTSQMNYAQVADKFFAITSAIIDTEPAERIVAEIAELDSASSVEGLAALLRPSTPVTPVTTRSAPVA